ncbi:MAG: hypothetical protein Q8P41_12770 [Pseudomonadota bacterium]|nr:hypothetical protein [Pseudomonadota bacterium]
MALLSLLALCACTAATGDTGGVEEDAAVDALMVGEDEVAVDVTVAGETFEVRCDAVGGEGGAYLALDGAEDVDIFSIACVQSSADPRRHFWLTVRDVDIDAGNVPLAGRAGVDVDQAQGVITDASGDGYHANLGGPGGTALGGTLRIADMGGARARGTFAVTWDRTGIVEGGAVIRYDPLPGRAVGAFDVRLQ